MHDPFEGARGQADTEFLLLALWRLRTAAVMCLEIVPDDAPVTAALATFDAALPHLKSVRHALMHFNNYILENSQRRNTRADSRRIVGRRDVDSHHNSPDGISWLGTDYALDRVTVESEHLYREVTEALHAANVK